MNVFLKTLKELGEFIYFAVTMFLLMVGALGGFGLGLSGASNDQLGKGVAVCIGSGLLGWFLARLGENAKMKYF